MFINKPKGNLFSLQYFDFQQWFKSLPNKRRIYIKRHRKQNYKRLLQKLKQDNNIKVSVLIPAYNEGPRIKKVLEVICSYSAVDQIVVVNDGSQDNTLEVINEYAKKCSNMLIVNLKKNQGKTGAVIKGMKKCIGDVVLMLDADLNGLKHEYLGKMLYFVVSKKYDMVILDRLTDRLSPFGLLGLARLFGGERAFWKKDFFRMDFSNAKGYALEGIMNNYFIKKGKKVRTILAPELEAEWQIKKWGLTTGLKRYAKEFWEMYKTNGIRNFYIQLTNIQDDPIVEIYELNEKLKSRKAINSVLRAGVLLATGIASIGVISFLSVKYLKNKVVKKGRS